MKFAVWQTERWVDWEVGHNFRIKQSCFKETLTDKYPQGLLSEAQCPFLT